MKCCPVYTNDFLDTLWLSFFLLPAWRPLGWRFLLESVKSCRILTHRATLYPGELGVTMETSPITIVTEYTEIGQYIFCVSWLRELAIQWYKSVTMETDRSYSVTECVLMKWYFISHDGNISVESCNLQTRHQVWCWPQHSGHMLCDVSTWNLRH